MNHVTPIGDLCQSSDKEFTPTELTNSEKPFALENSKPRLNRQNTFTIKDWSSSSKDLHPQTSSKNDDKKIVEMGQIRQFKIQKQLLEGTAKEAHDKLKALKDSLQRKKIEIESVKVLLEKIGQEFSLFDPELDSRQQLIKLTDDQLQNQKQLILLIGQEEKLLNELETTQRALADASLDEQAFAILNEEFDSVLQIYEIKTNEEFQKRKAREATATRNVNKLMKSKQAEKEAMKNQLLRVKSNDNDHGDDQDNQKQGQQANKITFQQSLKRIRKHMLATSNNVKETRAREESLKQMRQSRQYSSLAFLKKEIDDQKDALWAEAQARLKKAKNKKKLEERRRKELEDAGENPYLIERMQARIEMEKTYEKSLLENQQIIVNKIAHELEAEELAKLKQENQRKKWDAFWEKKVREKKRRAALRNAQFLANEEDIEKYKICSESSKNAFDEFPNKDESLVAETFFNFDVLKTDTKIIELTKRKLTNIFQNSNNQGKLSITSQRSAKGSNASGVEAPEFKTIRQSMASTKNGSLQMNSFLSQFSEHNEEGQGDVEDQRNSVHGISGLSKAEVAEESQRGSTTVNHSKLEMLNGINVNCIDLKTVQKETGSSPDFKWTPKHIVFKNFEIGQTYKRKISVTNISLERLKFYFKELQDSYSPIHPSDHSSTNTSSQPDLKINSIIQVDFQIPLPLSPGLSHDFHVAFTPTQIGDFFGVLQFESPKGPFEIQIKCLQKMFKPKLKASEMHFHNTVINSSSSMTVKVKNVGAKSGWLETIGLLSSITPAGMNLDNYIEETSTREVGNIEKQDNFTKEASKESMKKLKSESSVSKVKSSSSKLFNLKKESRALVDEVVDKITSNAFIAYFKEGKHYLDPGESVHLKVHFNPKSVGDFKSNFQLFADKESSIPPVNFLVEGSVMDCPINAVPLNTNFNICMIGFNYQQPISIINTSKFSGKVKSFVPEVLSEFVEVQPKEIQLFPLQTTTMSVKFKPRKHMMELPGIGSYFDSKINIIDFPVDFYLTDFPFSAPTPISCTFQSVLTTGGLEIFPKEIDLGHCSATETVRSKISISNNSLLTQQIGFAEVPQAVSIQPNYGFTALLPNETRPFDILVSLTSQMVGQQKFQFKVQSLGFEEYIINVIAIVKPQILCLSNSRIYFPATCCGSVVSAITEIFSTAAAGPKRKTRSLHTSALGTLSKFEFRIASGIPVEIRPRVGIVEPGKSVKVLVTFLANITDQEVKEYYLGAQKREYEDNRMKLQAELESINLLLSQYDKHADEEVDATNLEQPTSTVRNKNSLAQLKTTESKIHRRSNKSGEDELNKKENNEGVEVGNEKFSKKHKKPPRLTRVNNSNNKNKVGDDVQDSSQVPNSTDNIKDIKLEEDEPSPESKAKNKDIKGKKTSMDNTKSQSKRGMKNSSLESNLERNESHSNRRSMEKLRRRISNDQNMNEEQKNEILGLLKRKENIWNELLALDSSFVSSSSTTEDPSFYKSLEFGKVKRNFMQHLPTRSTNYILPCFVTDYTGIEEKLFLNVKCPIQQPDLILLDKSNVVDFGNVCVTGKSIKTVNLLNISPATLTIKMDIINPYGPFTRVNAVRKIHQDQAFNLKLKFCPTKEGFFEENVTICGGESRIELNLRGSAVIPEFFIKPSKPDVFIGTIRIRSTTFYQFEIENQSKALLEFEFKIIESGVYEGQYDGPEESKISPSTKSRLSLTPSAHTPPGPPPPSATKGEKHHKKRNSKSKTVAADDHQITTRSTTKSVEPKIASSSKIQSAKASKSNIKFEIIDDSGKKEQLNLEELTNHLEMKGQDVFFQVSPQRLQIQPRDKSNFSLHFIPMKTGHYFCKLNVCLLSEVVHRFTVVGRAYDDLASKSEIIE